MTARGKFWLSLWLALAACGGDDTVISAAGTGCVLASECNGSLACTFGRCHEECEEASDCDDDQMCVLDEERVRVCQLPEDVGCVFHSDCKIPLICARDLRCRNQCKDERDCATPTQLCVEPDRVCAEPADVETDENGVLRLRNALVDAGAEGGTSVGGAAGSSGSDMDSGMDSAVDASTPPTGDGATNVGPDAAQPPLDQEMEPNETRDEPTLITAGVPLAANIRDGDDSDYFAILVPSTNRAGGFFQGTLRDVGRGALEARVFDADTNMIVLTATDITIGSSVFFYWAGAAEKTYHVAIRSQPTGDESFDYTLLVDYTAIADPFEPNDTREEPAPLALGTTVTAYCYAGFDGDKPTAVQQQDWYAIDEALSTGMLTVRVENVATNQTLRVGLFDANNVRIDTFSGSAGASFDAVLPIETPGMYRIMIDPTVSSDYAGATQTVLDHFTRAYSLTATQ